MKTQMELLKTLTDIGSGALSSGTLYDHFMRNYDTSNGLSPVCERYRALIERFSALYDSNPVSIARSPGRINLIGEHTDYNGCPVLPIAVDRDMLIAFSATDEKAITMNSVDPAFEKRAFALEEQVPPCPTGDWANYAKAAVQALITYSDAQGTPCSELRGMKAVYSGTIPIAAGMSSSTSIVVSTAYAFMAVNDIVIPPRELSEILKEAEYYVGTQGGGMDQAIEINGVSGQALKIDFNPFDFRSVPLPRGYRAVVINSLVHAPKTQIAMDRYNRRSASCRMISAVLRELFSRHFGRDVPIGLIGDLREEKIGIPDESAQALALDLVRPGDWTAKDVGDILGRSPEQVCAEYLTRKDGTVADFPDLGIDLRARLKHVITEWNRVEESITDFRSGDMDRFGELMYASHESCAKDYRISCPELDEIVRLAREFGTPGARLTGAGFGGCAVAVIEKPRANDFLEFMRAQYYERYLPRHRPDILFDKDACSEFLFKTKATDGAGIIV